MSNSGYPNCVLGGCNRQEEEKIVTADVSGAFLLAKPVRDIYLLMPKDLTNDLLKLYPGVDNM